MSTEKFKHRLIELLNQVPPTAAWLDNAEKLSDELHKEEMLGGYISEYEDQMWMQLTDLIIESRM